MALCRAPHYSLFSASALDADSKAAAGLVSIPQIIPTDISILSSSSSTSSTSSSSTPHRHLIDHHISPSPPPTMANPFLFERFCSLIACILLLSVQLVHGQSSSTTSSIATLPSPTNAIIYAGNANWEYYGCYNETTEIPGAGGARALAGGEPNRSTSMTVPSCLDICKSKGTAFAGVEYSRECFCAQYINSLAAKLPDSECNTTCDGNSTQFCGGALKLSVYTTKKAASKGHASKLSSEAPVGSILALGIAMGTLLCLA